MSSCEHKNPEPACVCWYKPDHCRGINCDGCPECCSKDCATCAVKADGKTRHLTVKCHFETPYGVFRGNVQIRSHHSYSLNKKVQFCLILDGVIGINIVFETEQILLKDGRPLYRDEDFAKLTSEFQKNFESKIIKAIYETK